MLLIRRIISLPLIGSSIKWWKGVQPWNWVVTNTSWTKSRDLTDSRTRGARSASVKTNLAPTSLALDLISSEKYQIIYMEQLNRIIIKLPGNKLRVIQAILAPAFHTAKKMIGISMWLEAMTSTVSLDFSPRRRRAVDTRSKFFNKSLYFIDLPVVKSVCGWK